jgi:hypothetical protein
MIPGVLDYLCARTVHESNVFTGLGLALSEKQIPEVIENLGNQDNEWSREKRLWCFASRGPGVRIP